MTVQGDPLEAGSDYDNFAYKRFALLIYCMVVDVGSRVFWKCFSVTKGVRLYTNTPVHLPRLSESSLKSDVVTRSLQQNFRVAKVDVQTITKMCCVEKYNLLLTVVVLKMLCSSVP